MELLRPGLSIRPQVSLPRIQQLLLHNYGIDPVDIKQLNGYDDYNFHIKVDSIYENKFINEVWEFGYVLKIMNSLDSQDTNFVEGQHQLMYFLEKCGINVPTPVKNMKGDTFSLEDMGGSPGNVVRLLTYKPGKTLAMAEPDDELMLDVGLFVGKLSMCINVFRHLGYTNRKSIWMLESVHSIQPFMYVISDNYKLEIITQVLQEFQDTVIENIHLYKKGLIHGDINEHNVIVEDNKVSAIVDFGDSHYSLIVFELAITICYILIHSNNLKSPKKIIEGYLTNCELDINERKILKICVCARLCQSLVLGLYSHTQDPGNNYVLGTQKNGWKILLTIHNWQKEEIKEFWNLDIL